MDAKRKSHLPDTNPEIAALLSHLADLLEIEGANPFRVRAYRTAARFIHDLSYPVADLVHQGEDLTQFPGIGEALASKITTLVKTGQLPSLKTLGIRVPPTLAKLLAIEGLGPKRVKALRDQLHISNINDLKRAVRQGKIAKLSGFGEKTEALIKAGIQRIDQSGHRISLFEAEKTAERVLHFVRQIPGVKTAEIAGSFRRRQETVGDLDILAVAHRGAAVINAFVQFADVIQVISRGTTRSTVFLRTGIQVDLRVVPAESYGAALHYFTGSKSHNIAIRKMALKKRWKVNEYGVFKGRHRIAGKTEKEFYATFNLPYIEPELRENRGELEAAKQHQLPTLIQLKDIRGDLHCHTNATDGQYPLDTMVQAAAEKGYEYIAITDHSQHLTVAHGLDKKRLLAQIKAIDRLNSKLSRIRILKAIEVDILTNGKLDLPNGLLKELDLTVCSVHYQFTLSKEKQTERILRAMDNPYFNILAHPTARLIGKRDPYALDIERLMRAAKERGCLLEINAQPTRLDLNDLHCKMAKEIGVLFVISTDTHQVNHFDFMRFGIDIARRGWLEKENVANTRSLSRLLPLLHR